jgi:hypothetical protein
MSYSDNDAMLMKNAVFWDGILHSHRWEHLKSYNVMSVSTQFNKVFNEQNLKFTYGNMKTQTQ